MVLGKIILAGDPHQLEAVILSDYATKCGLKNSFMERLFKKPSYSLIDGKYDSRFTVELRKNYRSHKDLIHISNTLFYNGMLECLAPAGK